MADEYRALLDALPLQTIEYAFAYGSGVLQQKNENKSDKMVDFILCTSDPLRFHEENLARNSNHYSMIRFAGPKLLEKYQCGWGARIFYNTQIKVGSRLIKYGIISTNDAQSDLLDWRWMYVAGRLQKPVLDVIEPSTAMKTNILENRKSALQAALLMLPDNFTAEELFTKIVCLSYLGDFRMTFGEDKNKIGKIVLGSMEHLHGVYDPLLNDDPRIVSQNGKYLQDANGTAIYHRLHLLPSNVLRILQKSFNNRYRRHADCEEVLFGMAHQHDVAPSIENAIASIVAPTARSQTTKNAITAGITRSIVYASAKLVKMAKSAR